MSKLRDEIAELVYVYANRRESGFAYPTDQMVANEILDKVREALLSDEAVASGEQKWHEIQDDGVNYEGDDERFRASITAALDAVTGEGDR